MYIYELYKDFRTWFLYSRIAKRNTKLLAENNLRVDWLGRIYTVINVPEDASQMPNIEMWVLQQLSPYNKILLELGIADYSFPEISKIDEPGTNAFLVVMYPELNNINIWRIILEIAKWVLFYYIFRVTWSVCFEYHIFEKISNFLNVHG